MFWLALLCQWLLQFANGACLPSHLCATDWGHRLANGLSPQNLDSTVAAGFYGLAGLHWPYDWEPLLQIICWRHFLAGSCG